VPSARLREGSVKVRFQGIGSKSCRWCSAIHFARSSESVRDQEVHRCHDRSLRRFDHEPGCCLDLDRYDHVQIHLYGDRTAPQRCSCLWWTGACASLSTVAKPRHRRCFLLRTSLMSVVSSTSTLRHVISVLGLRVLVDIQALARCAPWPRSFLAVHQDRTIGAEKGAGSSI